MTFSTRAENKRRWRQTIKADCVRADIYLPPNLHAELRDNATATNRSLSAVLTEFLLHYRALRGRSTAGDA